jgi:hypothetical protein
MVALMFLRRSSEPVGVSLHMTPLRFANPAGNSAWMRARRIAANTAKLPELSKPEVI